MYDYIIGMDIAKPPWDNVDFSCISMMCLNCKTFIHTELFKGKTPILNKPLTCPECGIMFKEGITLKTK